MMRRPQSSEPEIHPWFWGETSAGRLVADIAKRMNEAGDLSAERIAFGIAR